MRYESKTLHVVDVEKFRELFGSVPGISITSYDGVTVVVNGVDVQNEFTIAPWPEDPAGFDPDWLFRMMAPHLRAGTVGQFWSWTADQDIAVSVTVVNPDGELRRVELARVVAQAAKELSQRPRFASRKRRGPRGRG